MDTSETYIKMCDCEEIEGLWNPKDGDYFAIAKDLETGALEVYARKGEVYHASKVLHDYPFGNIYFAKRWNEDRGTDETRIAGLYYLHKFKYRELIWLPRQDQLQEMVGGFEAGFVLWRDWLKNIYGRGYFDPVNRTRKFASMEQLWLSYVMSECYQKIWDGKEWSSEKTTR